MDEEQEMLLDFVVESLEILETAEPMIISLDQDFGLEEKTEAVNTVFRLFHSLKGGAGFLNLDTIKEVTHTAENLLQYFRKNPTIKDAKSIDTLTQTADLIRTLLEQVQTDFHDKGFEENARVIIEKLESNIERISSTSPSIIESSQSHAITAPAPPFKHLASGSTPVDIDKPRNEGKSEEINLQEDSSSSDIDELEELTLSPEMMDCFVQEAEEQLVGTEGALLVVEQLGNDEDSIEFIGTAFRNIHTLKGNSGFLGLSKVEKLAHQAETVLDSMKLGHFVMKEGAIQVLLKVVDTLRSGVKSLAENQPLNLPNYDDILKEITSIVEGKPVESASQLALSVSEEPIEEKVESIDTSKESMLEPVKFEEFKEIGIPVHVKQPAAFKLDEKPLQKTTPARKEKSDATTAVVRQPIKQADIRVNLSKVEKLINLVGELVISEAMVSHNPDLDGLTLERFVKASRQLNKNVKELQEVALSMRMLPISGVFRKMIRVVHDVSRKSGKNVDLVLVGEETEVDRTVVEQIGDPLLHIIRNAVDHGIDSPEEREATNKLKTGKITLEARHSGNEIWIMVSDDGRGLNREKILSRAVEKELISEDDELEDGEIWKLIFAPGFSTVEKVTDLSGRGVGMDVVQRNIEKLRGRIDITSTEGKGSNFLLRIPLTLAIIEGMLIRVGKTIYVFPILGIRESLQPRTESIINTNEGIELVQIREDLIPVIRLHELHDLEPDSKELSDGIVVVIEDESKQACLFVDEVVGERQVVVKGLPKYFGNISHLAGCTILGNGDISLILDLISIINN